MHEIEKAKDVCEEIIEAVGNIYVGDRLLLKKLLAAGAANGHVLFEDYPGLGKTLLAKAFARAIGCEYSRIQFTPDLLPADIVGAKVWREKDLFELEKGPIFADIILADEINRAPPKTQSALLEAMEEKQVTIEGETHSLGNPFIVIATQNPIEQEGTYPLPEAQLDRFLLKLSTGYPASIGEENKILSRRISWKQDDPTAELKPAITREGFRELQKLVETQIYVDDCILDYISKIVRVTREKPQVEIGSSPRGGIALLKVSRAIALINGRDFVTPDDVKLFIKDALSHRIILDMEYTLEGLKAGDVIEEVIQAIPVPKDFKPR
ncbi:MAG: MoxR family ATPase [Candidatus Syntrophoarchaeum sp.]|nr:MoxR family ATPase [Methanomicrobia archaeon]MBL7117277.1 MoxR family ATPase [Candidatus Syntrophoarchaeum sp.]